MHCSLHALFQFNMESCLLEFSGKSWVFSATEAALFACWRDFGIREKSRVWKKLGMWYLPAILFSLRNAPEAGCRWRPHLLYIANSRPARAPYQDPETDRQTDRQPARLREEGGHCHCLVLFCFTIVNWRRQLFYGLDLTSQKEGNTY